jgi:hypothetical protein
MTDRLDIDRLLRRLYSARVQGDLDGVCGTFSHDAKFQIAGASHVSPIAITALGLDEIRSWLALIIKTFQINDQTILSLNRRRGGGCALADKNSLKNYRRCGHDRAGRSGANPGRQHRLLHRVLCAAMDPVRVKAA